MNTGSAAESGTNRARTAKSGRERAWEQVQKAKVFGRGKRNQGQVEEAFVAQLVGEAMAEVEDLVGPIGQAESDNLDHADPVTDMPEHRIAGSWGRSEKRHPLADKAKPPVPPQSERIEAMLSREDVPACRIQGTFKLSLCSCLKRQVGTPFDRYVRVNRYGGTEKTANTQFQDCAKPDSDGNPCPFWITDEEYTALRQLVKKGFAIVPRAAAGHEP